MEIILPSIAGTYHLRCTRTELELIHSVIAFRVWIEGGNPDFIAPIFAPSIKEMHERMQDQVKRALDLPVYEHVNDYIKSRGL